MFKYAIGLLGGLASAILFLAYQGEGVLAGLLLLVLPLPIMLVALSWGAVSAAIAVIFGTLIIALTSLLPWAISVSITQANLDAIWMQYPWASHLFTLPSLDDLSSANPLAALAFAILVASPSAIYAVALIAQARRVVPNVVSSDADATSQAVEKSRAIVYINWLSLGSLLLLINIGTTISIVATTSLAELLGPQIHQAHYQATIDDPARPDRDRMPSIRQELHDVLRDYINTTPSAPTLTDGQLNSIVDIAIRLSPVLLGAYWLLLMVANLWAAARITQASSQLRRPWEDLSRSVTWPRPLAAIALLSFFAAFAPSPLGLVASVLAGTMLTSAVLLGLCVTHLYLRGKPSRFALLTLLYLLMLITILPVPVLALLGLADCIFNLRGRMRASAFSKS